MAHISSWLQCDNLAKSWGTYKAVFTNSHISYLMIDVPKMTSYGMNLTYLIRLIMNSQNMKIKQKYNDTAQTSSNIGWTIS